MSPPASSLSPGVVRGAVVAVLAATAVATAGSACAQSGGRSQTQAFDIPAQPAAEALVRLCLVADCELALIGASGTDQRSSPVQGRMNWRTALSRMLSGTDLSYRFVGARGVQVWRDPAPARRPPPARAEPDEVETVFVVGRVSEQIEESLRRKRRADVILDSASAARIGELPAANLAEALQRVPGVAVEREVGEGQFVSVRGLGPLFQSVTLNGSPFAFNENIRNSTQSGRQFRFRALSADLLAGAQVSKSAAADMIEGGIGANIDVETVGGLDGDPFLSVRVGASVEDRLDQVRPDVSVAGRLVSQDGTWGVVGGLSQEGRSVIYDRFQIQRYGELAVDGQAVAVPSDVRTTVEREDRLRRSLFLGGEWRASPHLRVTLDGLASTFDNAIREDRLVYGLGEALGQAGAELTVIDGVATAGAVQAGKIDSNTEFSDQAHLNLIGALGVEATIGRWTAAARLSGSRARSRLDTPLQRISFETTLPVAYGFDVSGAAARREVESLETGFEVLDPGALSLQRFGVRAIESVDDDVTLRLDVRRPVAIGLGGAEISEIRLGAQVSDRGRDYQRRDREASLREGVVLTPDFHGLTVPADVFDALVRRHPGVWAVADFDLFRDAFVLPGEKDGVVVVPSDLAPTASDMQNSYTVGERIAAAYARADFLGDLKGVPFFGNAGLRLVGARTEVGGGLMTSGEGGVAEVKRVSSESDGLVLLPSANIAFDLRRDTRIRLAASRTMTRPSLADLRIATAPASTLVSAIYDRGAAEISHPSPGTIFSGVGGSPDLKPYVSTNLDLSYERAFQGGAFSLAVFHKRIDDYIGSVATMERLVFETRAGPLVEADVLMSRPQNLGRATSQGVEVGLHRRLSSGFGLWASATWTDSRGPAGQARLSGVSDFAYSINPFYERGPLSAALSWSWRSAFRSEADMQGGGVSDFTIAPAGYLDAQVALDLGQGVELAIQASNLTDTTDLAYEGDPSRLLQIGRVGPSLSVSFRWLFNP